MAVTFRRAGGRRRASRRDENARPLGRRRIWNRDRDSGAAFHSARRPPPGYARLNATREHLVGRISRASNAISQNGVASAPSAHPTVCSSSSRQVPSSEPHTGGSPERSQNDHSIEQWNRDRCMRRASRRSRSCRVRRAWGRREQIHEPRRRCPSSRFRCGTFSRRKRTGRLIAVAQFAPARPCSKTEGSAQ